MDKLPRPFASQMRALKSRGGSELMLDMLLAAAVPMIISGVAMEWRRVHPMILRFLASWTRWEREPKFVRTIEYEESSMFGGENDENYECRRNNLLHRAILLYMGQELDLRYSKAQVLLSAVKEKQEFDMDDDYYGGGSKKAVHGGTAEQLKAYSVSVVPPKRDWVSLGDGVLFFQQSTTESEGAGGGSSRHAGAAKKTVTFTFASHKADGDLRIQGFLNKAFLWYCKAMESTEDHVRYYYTPLTAPGGRAKASQASEGGWDAPKPAEPKGAVQMYKRYRLGNEKSFDTLFFPEKELLLKILDNFQHKTGKYGIKGYPHKLGLLLHGPPGTGKSSLIKALALHTERHVIDVPLARIKTNQDLMDIIFDENFPVDNQGIPITLAVENVIFVMEDVDATSSIVRSRAPAQNNTRTTTQPQDKQTEVRKPAARSQAGTAERAAALTVDSAEKEECTAAATQTIGASAPTNTTTTNVATPTAPPSETQSGSTTANDLSLTNPWEVPALPRVGGCVDGNRRRGGGAGEGEVDTNNDAAAGNGENEKGRSTDTRAESVLGTALLRLTGEAAAKKTEAEAREKESSSMADRLDLAGLLNVLDGVVDSPGRIVIMTTNFPDALDAALIRPGRIDKKIHLGYMKYEAAKEMTRHFFEVDQLTVGQDQRLRSVFDEDRPLLGDSVVGRSTKEAEGGAGRKITPAVVEQLAGEFDDVDTFIGALEAF